MTRGRKPAAQKPAQEKKKCYECSNEKPLAQFYKSNNPKHQLGVMNLCKSCSTPENIHDIEEVKRKLYGIDRPFISDLWNNSIDEVKRRGMSENSVYGIYLKNIQMRNSKYEFATWSDSDIETKETNLTFNTPKTQFVVTEELIDKWGTGYLPEEIQQFEKKYKRLINNYGEKTALHTEGLLTYIRYRVKEEMATASGNVKDAKEWGTLAAKAAQDAKINVSQLSKSDISGGVDVLSQLFEAVETEVGIIPLLPKVLEQPYDDADLIIWATVNYNRRLEDKSPVQYRDIWNFYDEMLQEHFIQQGFDEQKVKEFKGRRNNVFRDLSQVYKEPLYESDGE